MSTKDLIARADQDIQQTQSWIEAMRSRIVQLDKEIVEGDYDQTLGHNIHNHELGYNLPLGAQ